MTPLRVMSNVMTMTVHETAFALPVVTQSKFAVIAHSLWFAIGGTSVQTHGHEKMVSKILTHKATKP